MSASEVQHGNLKLGTPSQWASLALPGRPQALTTAGFTIVELIVVITILAILAAFAAPRFTNNQAFLDRGYYEEVSNGLRLAQKLAVGSGCPVRFTLTTTGYDARQQAAVNNRCDAADTSWAVAIMLPDGSSLQGTAPTGTITNPAVTMVFTGLGATNLGANQTVSVGGSSFVVHAASGYIDAP